MTAVDDRPLLLCDAVPFGFGPASKLVAILERLEGHPIRIVSLAAGTSADLLTEVGVETVAVDVEDAQALKGQRSLFERADLFLNVMNPTSLAYAQSYGCPTVSVDSLFWMWAEVDEGSRRSDAYFVQNFPGVSQRLTELAGEIDNGVLTGPIIQRARRRNRGSDYDGTQVLVHLGGLESAFVRFGQNLRYPFLIARALERALDNHPYDRVLVAGNARLQTALADCQIPRLEVALLPRTSFLEELARSEFVITSPGLTTTYECFAHGVPVFFLPPQNFSQVHILRTLRSLRVAPLSVSWSDFELGIDVPPRIDETEGVRRVLALIERADDDAKVVNVLSNGISAALELETSAMVERQRAFIGELGGDGAETVATQVLEMLLSPSPN